MDTVELNDRINLVLDHRVIDRLLANVLELELLYDVLQSVVDEEEKSDYFAHMVRYLKVRK